MVVMVGVLAVGSRLCPRFISSAGISSRVSCVIARRERKKSRRVQQLAAGFFTVYFLQSRDRSLQFFYDADGNNVISLRN